MVPVYKKLTAELRDHYAKIAGAKTESKIAAVYSYENSWGTRGWRVDGFYDEEFFNAYGGFKNALQTNVDVICIQDDFSGYDVVIMPNHRIVTEAQAAKVEEFVRNGGIVVMNTWTGMHDENNQTRPLQAPGLFAPMCGAKAIGYISAAGLESQTGKPSQVEFPGGIRCNITSHIDKLKLNGAETVATYTTGKLEGTPAVTINAFGNGYAVLCATDGNDVYYYEALASWLKQRFDIKPLLDVDDGIITSSRVKDGVEYRIAVNMKERPVKVRLDHEMYDVLNDRRISGEIELAGYDTLFVCD
jgi:beta-galactosidase